MTTPSFHRIPYVGEGADGCRRSAEIDRNEADTVDSSDPRKDYLLGSAARWIQQAEFLEAQDAVASDRAKLERVRVVERSIAVAAEQPVGDFTPSAWRQLLYMAAHDLRAALGDVERGGPVTFATAVKEFRAATPELADRCSRCGHGHDEEYQCELDCVTCGIEAEKKEERS